MKKIFITLIALLLLVSSFSLGFFVKKFVDDKNYAVLNIEKENLQAEIDSLQSSKTRLNNIINGFNIAPIDFYLYDEDPNRFELIHINKNGNVEYKGKVLYTDNGKPLNRDTAYTTIELKVLFAAERIEPREGCDSGDTAKNGTLGCYVDIPDNN